MLPNIPAHPGGAFEPRCCIVRCGCLGLGRTGIAVESNPVHFRPVWPFSLGLGREAPLAGAYLAPLGVVPKRRRKQRLK